jgi:hypothetical protein
VVSITNLLLLAGFAFLIYIVRSCFVLLELVATRVRLSGRAGERVQLAIKYPDLPYRKHVPSACRLLSLSWLTYRACFWGSASSHWCFVRGLARLILTVGVQSILFNHECGRRVRSTLLILRVSISMLISWSREIRSKKVAGIPRFIRELDIVLLIAPSRICLLALSYYSRASTSANSFSRRGRNFENAISSSCRI